MAAIVNDRDVLLQAAGTRVLATSLPSTVTVDFLQVNGTTRPSNNADVTATIVNGGLIVTGGGITLSGGGSIKGGQTAYNTGIGFFLGYSGFAYRLSLGDPAGHYLTWDGSTLSINGSITLTNTIPVGSVSGLAATATSSDFAAVTGATKPSNNADVTLSAVNGGLVVTGGGITLSAGGAIKGGQSAYNTGTGFFLGYSGGAYKLSLGVAGGTGITWDGAALNITGAITGASSIDLTGTAKFGGAATVGGWQVAGSFNAGYAANSGVIGWATSSPNSGVIGDGASGATGVYGHSTSGHGVDGIADNAGGVGVNAQGILGAIALQLWIGAMTTNNSTLVTNLNANFWKGIDCATSVGSGTANAPFTSTNKPGANGANNWWQVNVGGTPGYIPIWT